MCRSDLTPDEQAVLGAFAWATAGGTEPHCNVLDDLRPAVDGLKKKGLICQVWVLSTDGEIAIGRNPDPWDMR